MQSFLAFNFQKDSCLWCWHHSLSLTELFLSTSQTCSGWTTTALFTWLLFVFFLSKYFYSNFLLLLFIYAFFGNRQLKLWLSILEMNVGRHINASLSLSHMHIFFWFHCSSHKCLPHSITNQLKIPESTTQIFCLPLPISKLCSSFK